MIKADIIVYGGSFSAVAAAVSAAENAADKTVVVIVPEPIAQDESCFGSIGTIGGQNFFDERKWNGRLVYGGSYAKWRADGQFYNTDSMAAKLEGSINSFGSQISVYKGYDISNVLLNMGHICSITVRKLARASSGNVQWNAAATDITIEGTIYIDASDTGRLSRLSGASCTVGRYDWAEALLEEAECGSNGRARQQAATLMFKLKGVNTSAVENIVGGTGTRAVFELLDGIYCAAAGHDTYYNNPIVKAFNDKYGPLGFALKPFNAAQNGIGSDEYWMNMLLVFNVDGRACNRDIGTPLFPTDMRADYKTTDDAYVEALNFIQTDDFLTALHQFPGLETARLVLDASGQPDVGKILYLREVAHNTLSSNLCANNTDNSNYALRRDDCLNAGASINIGADSRNYENRIGLNFYWADINAYQFADLKNDETGEFIWAEKINRKILGSSYAGNLPVNPMYIPFGVLTTDSVSNLLVSGYSTGVSSLAWAEVRVIPNLCVLGDAAGVAAAYAVNNNKMPSDFSTDDIAKLQTCLENNNVRLEK